MQDVTPLDTAVFHISSYLNYPVLGAFLALYGETVIPFL